MYAGKSLSTWNFRVHLVLKFKFNFLWTYNPWWKFMKIPSLFAALASRDGRVHAIASSGYLLNISAMPIYEVHIILTIPWRSELYMYIHWRSSSGPWVGHLLNSLHTNPPLRGQTQPTSLMQFCFKHVGVKLNPYLLWGEMTGN